jgi:hypothetical protein
LRSGAGLHAADTVPCHTGWQVNLMRFSSVFQLPVVPRDSAAAAEPARAETAAPEQSPPVLTPSELPEDLDARVRLIGEWQLGEGY